MNLFRHFIAGACIAALALPASAQELSGQLTVHGQRNAEIRLRERLALLPSLSDPKITLDPLAMASKGVVTQYTPDFTLLPPMGWRDALAPADNDGYFRFGAGSFLDMTASAGYRFRPSEVSTAGVWLQYDGSSLYRPARSLPFRRRYDGTAGLYGTYKLGRAGSLRADAFYSLGYFNYYSAPWAFSQTRNTARVRLGWESAPGSTVFAAAAEYGYFGFRRLYIQSQQNGIPGQKENILNLRGSALHSLNAVSVLRLDADLSMMFYSGCTERSDAAPVFDSSMRADDYGRLRLTPAYRLRRGHLNLELGAILDMTWNAGVPSDRFSFFHVAPDIRVSYRNGITGMFARIEGGTELNTLASAWRQDYYTMPQLTSTTPVYSPLDAAVGVNFQPGAGLSFGIEAMYKISNNHNQHGWYPAWLTSVSAPSLDAVFFGADARYDLRGFGAALTAEWKWGDKALISARGEYTPQSGSTGYFNGYDRPRWTLDTRASVSPLDGLDVALTYRYRGVRSLTYRTIGTEPGTTILQSVRIPDLALLGAEASYRIIRPVTLWLRADNILGCHASSVYEMTDPGFSLTGGVSIVF